MVIDAHGAFVTQREHPRIALVETAIEGDELRLRLPGSTEVASVPLRHEDLAHRPRRHVKVWKDEVEAIDVGGPGAELLSDHLRQHSTLVFMPPETLRQVDPRSAREGDRVGFADAFPVLIASLTSLADLNARLPNTVSPFGIDRFRANIIVSGGEAWAEERTHATVGTVSFRTPKKCSRCIVIATNQQTAVVGKEPLRTLAAYRREGNNANFAMNAIPDLDDVAEVAIGDLVSFYDVVS